MREMRWVLQLLLLAIAANSPLRAGEPPKMFDRLTFHAAAKPLPAGAVKEDWPRFLGPRNNATSAETMLLKTWQTGGPQRVWEVAKGSGFAAPAIVGDHLVLFHRQEGREIADCLDPETGRRYWSHGYDAPYQDRYGAGDGPRASPVIAGGRVYLYGITGMLHCLDLASGTVLWKKDCRAEFDLAPAFFGCGSTPLVIGERLIMNLGTTDGMSAVAMDPASGKVLWRTKQAWGASYASPIPATLHGRECVLIFAGGESRPPVGGLLCLDAGAGAVLSETPHRADIAESVNASSPVVAGNRVFVTESYGSGGEMVEIQPDLSARSLWKTQGLGAYFMTPLVKDEHLYGCDGQSPRLTELVCLEVATGKEQWRNDLGGKFGRTSLLAADAGVLCLGEFGDLAWLDVSPKGVKILQQAKLFNAPDTWALPALSRGLLFVCQNQRSAKGEAPRLICYDLRATP